MAKLPEPTPPTESQTIHDWAIWKDSNGVWWKSDGKQIAEVFEGAAPTERVETSISDEVIELKERVWQAWLRNDRNMRLDLDVLRAVAPSPAGESQTMDDIEYEDGMLDDRERESHD